MADFDRADTKEPLTESCKLKVFAERWHRAETHLPICMSRLDAEWVLETM